MMLYGPDGKPIMSDADPLGLDQPTVEIVRSFSFKLNVGNYESRDFFCSQKVVCDAIEVDEVSSKVYQWCKQQVLGAVREYKREEAAAERRMAPRREMA